MHKNYVACDFAKNDKDKDEKKKLVFIPLINKYASKRSLINAIVLIN